KWCWGVVVEVVGVEGSGENGENWKEKGLLRNGWKYCALHSILNVGVPLKLTSRGLVAIGIPMLSHEEVGKFIVPRSWSLLESIQCLLGTIDFVRVM
nr:hypothetical protein [Tanacetum cinerariifolium]